MGRLPFSLVAALAGVLGCAAGEPQIERLQTAGPTKTGTQPQVDDDDGDDAADALTAIDDADDSNDTVGTAKPARQDADPPAKPASRPSSSSTKPGDESFVPPPEICGMDDTSVAPVIPDMLIVLDRSGSMMTLPRPNAPAVDRWNPSVKGVKAITNAFDKSVAFGLMVFPTELSMCAPGEVRVPVGRDNAAKIAQSLDTILPMGGTPTGETLQRALAALTQAPSDTPRYVLLVTDGQPTCPTSNAATINPANLEQDKQLTLRSIEALAKANIKTFVVGYDAQLDPALAGSLTDFAKKGGTNKYYPVQDEKSLVAAFTEITKTIRSCEFKFKEWIDDPRYVTVSLDGKPLGLNDPDGWSFNEQVITLVGKACQVYQENASHTVAIKLECVPQ